MAKTKPKTNAAVPCVPGVPTESEITPDDPHYNIPRDAKGDPIFFILPPDIQQSYKHRLLACERGWSTTGDPAFIAEALIWSHLHRQPNPPWLTDAAVPLVLARRTKTQANRVRERRVQWVRFTTVRNAKEQGLRWLQARIEGAAKTIIDLRKQKGINGERIEAVQHFAEDAKLRAEKIRQRGWVTWEEARVLAAEGLCRTEMKGEPDTMHKDYDRVKRDLKAGRGGLYFLPKLPRKSLTEVLGAHD